MNVRLEKTKANKITSVASNFSEKQSSGMSTSQFLNNRPDAIAQRKLQDTANNSHQVKQLRALQKVAGNSLQPKQSSRPILQRQIDGVVQQELPKNIYELAITYNQLDEETTVSDRIGSLSQVEHAVYAWLTANKAPDMNEVQGSAAVRNLMDTTKAERHRIVAYSVNVSRDHLGEGGIPIAGFGTLGQTEQEEVRAMWRGLIEGTGNIRILDTESDSGEQHEGFGMKVLVEFSRLLEGRFGRSMVKDINTSDHRVVIEPFHVDNDQHKSFAASPTAEEQGVDKLTKLDAQPADELRAHYPETNITDNNEEQRLRLFNQLKPTQEGQLGVRLVDAGVTTYYKFGAGSAVKVTMPSDLPDSSQYKESRLADAAGNELATPVFITLGHELGHGIHMQRGTLTKETEIPRFFGGEADQEAYLGDREEYVNIEGNENALRAEHGLGKRKGHYNIPYLQKQQMEQQITPWFAWIDSLGSLKDLPVYREIDQMLGAMGTRIYTEWAKPDTLAALKDDFAELPEEIRTLQLNYLRDHFARHMAKENEKLMLELYGLRFSFNVGVDIAYMVMAIGMEFDLEKVQAPKAVQSRTLPQFLAELPEQRQSYARVKLAPKVDLIERGIHPQEENGDQEEFAKLTGVLNSFENVSWLFPG